MKQYVSCQTDSEPTDADEGESRGGGAQMPRKVEEAFREASVVWHDSQRWQGSNERGPASLLSSPLLRVHQALEQGAANPLRSALHNLRCALPFPSRSRNVGRFLEFSHQFHEIRYYTFNKHRIMRNIYTKYIYRGLIEYIYTTVYI